MDDAPVLYEGTLALGQLEANRGGYYYLPLPAEVVAAFPEKRNTRLICELLEGRVRYRCGLNHMGDGGFFVIVAGSHLTDHGLAIGDRITCTLRQDPDPLGVDMPEVLTVLLDQDEALAQKFNALPMGKRRNLIFTITRVKDIDRQIAQAIKLLG